MKARIRVKYSGVDLVVDCGSIDAMVPEPTCSCFSGIREMYARNVYLHCFDMNRIPRQCAIDAGGNRGLFTVFSSHVFRDVLYVEADPQYGRSVRRLIDDNPSSCNISIHLTFLTDLDGDRKATVATLLTLRDIPSVSFFKCDIEGEEFALFRYGKSCLEKVDNIAMEVHTCRGDPATIVANLLSGGFAVYSVDASLCPVTPSMAAYIYASRTGALDGAIRRALQKRETANRAIVTKHAPQSKL